ncbi:EAL domain-containing protein [Halomonas nitroreducens]|uniref:EAL domain-containing protein n=1 Tax=Halomonas nitroreducens TaxID=447425 RepID=A0A3S0K3K9_9GAMM|nr:EAL domain-containing protein [Halomonas nitroreducens]RTR04378.1 EAL domain-containing protein [Halomonas nitroreducens]
MLDFPAVLSRLAVERSPVGLVLLDAGQRILWVNAGFRSLLTSASGEVVGRPVQELISHQAFLGSRVADDVGLQGGAWQQVRLGDLPGNTGRLLLMARTSLPDSPEGVTHLLTFIDPQEASLAPRPGLLPPLPDVSARLASVWLFEDRLRHALERADRLEQGVGLLLIRLDPRQELQDSLAKNRLEGLARQVGRRLGQTLRSEDSLSQLGQDCWGVLIEHPMSPERLQATAMRCQEAMDPPFRLEGQSLLLTLSIGIATYPSDGESPEQLMTSAESALERAGPATHAFFDEGLRSLLAQRLAFRQQLQDALQHPDRHFQLLYQPQIDLSDGRCVGLEALVRWRHPKRGLLVPEDFLSVVAELGQQVRLDRWVITRAILQQSEWRARDSRLADLPVAVNADGGMLDQAVFDRRPLDVFLRQQADRLDWLSLELSQQGLIARAGPQAHLLRRVKALGVGVVVNDIGAGPLDVAHLGSLPVSRVKLSPVLMASLGAPSPSSRHPLAALLPCLSGLGLESVVVGVETAEQLETARRLGSRIVQGNRLCEPLAPAALERWLAQGAAPT